MNSQIGKFLVDIDTGVPINIDAFNKTLAANKLHRYTGSDNITMLSKVGNKYVVELSIELRSELNKFRQSTKMSRSEAAKSSDSHSVRVNGSLLIAKHEGEHPFVVVFDKDGNYDMSNENVYDSVLIIENRQCFLDSDNITLLLPKGVERNSLLIVFGSGNEVSNQLHAKFLQQFDQVFYYMDIDLGGLKIATSVFKLCNNRSSHNFMIHPKTFEMMNLASVKGRLTLKEKELISFIAKRFPFLLDACNMMLKTGKKVEQEAFL